MSVQDIGSKVLSFIEGSKVTAKYWTHVNKVDNKTMYVGDTLTKEEVLSWATFTNTDGLVQGFEVVGTKIPVYSDDKLTTTGAYTIKYYVQTNAKDAGNNLAEKEIILIVKDKEGITPDISNPTNNISSGTTTPSTEKSLPSTGEKATPMLTLIGAIAVLTSGIYALTLKRKKSNTISINQSSPPVKRLAGFLCDFRKDC